MSCLLIGYWDIAVLGGKQVGRPGDDEIAVAVGAFLYIQVHAARQGGVSDDLLQPLAIIP